MVNFLIDSNRSKSDKEERIRAIEAYELLEDIRFSSHEILERDPEDGLKEALFL